MPVSAAGRDRAKPPALPPGPVPRAGRQAEWAPKPLGAQKVMRGPMNEPTAHLEPHPLSRPRQAQLLAGLHQNGRRHRWDQCQGWAEGAAQSLGTKPCAALRPHPLHHQNASGVGARPYSYLQKLGCNGFGGACLLRARLAVLAILLSPTAGCHLMPFWLSNPYLYLLLAARPPPLLQ